MYLDLLEGGPAVEEWVCALYPSIMSQRVGWLADSQSVIQALHPGGWAGWKSVTPTGTPRHGTIAWCTDACTLLEREVISEASDEEASEAAVRKTAAGLWRTPTDRRPVSAPRSRGQDRVHIQHISGMQYGPYHRTVNTRERNEHRQPFQARQLPSKTGKQHWWGESASHAPVHLLPLQEHWHSYACLEKPVVHPNASTGTQDRKKNRCLTHSPTRGWTTNTGSTWVPQLTCTDEPGKCQEEESKGNLRPPAHTERD